jgi:hypothetical protein
MMFSTNSDIATDEVYAARLGRLAFLKGEGEGEAWASASRFEQRCEVAFVGSKTPHLSPLPFSKGRGDRPRTICCALRSLQGQAA